MVRDRFVCRCYHVTYDFRIEILGGPAHLATNNKYKKTVDSEVRRRIIGRDEDTKDEGAKAAKVEIP